MERPTRFQLLFDARLNKGTAFTEAEREQFGLLGLLPDSVESEATQIARVKLQYAQQPTDLMRYQYLSALQDRNERLFYALLRSDIQTYMPIVYTPTVGEACQQFGHIMRRPKGMYLSIRHRGRVREVLRNWLEQDIRFIVVTDGERILGLGDQGTCGMGIPVGKLALYTACAGVPPQATLPVVLDVGTNNEAFLADPMYPGLRARRTAGEDYFAFVDEFVDAVQEVFPSCCIQFEDFTNAIAIPLLARHRDRVCCFNDDIQGTAAVALAGLFGACRMAGTRMEEQRILFMGAGNAAVGIADLFVTHLVRQGIDAAAARARCWFMNSRGLVTPLMPGLPSYLAPFTHDAAGLAFAPGTPSSAQSPCTSLRHAVDAIRPTALIGVSTVAGAFDQAVVEAMTRAHPRPIIFPLSNPTSKSECTAEQAIRWSDGAAIFAAGSPFAPLHWKGRLHVPGQGNNVYIYPAIGMAVYATRAHRVTDDMFLKAAEALARQTTEHDLSVGLIYPPVSDILQTSIAVATEVATLVHDSGLARVPRPADIGAHLRSLVYDPSY